MFAAVATDFMSKEHKLIRKSMGNILNEYLSSDEKWMNGKYINRYNVALPQCMLDTNEVIRLKDRP